MHKYILITLQSIALIVFLALIAILFFVEYSTSLVWTMVVPLVPIAIIVLGFSNWRKVCPLAFFSKLSQRLNWIPKRKVPIWFENNFYYFQYFLLFFAFSLRLILLNYDTLYLGIFFVLVIIAAFMTNLIFTGKSWCNFFCPVGVVEKIYCGSNAKNYTTNSACSKCSACKVNCPDIDMESNYWKESVNEQKTFAFYSFAGLILGFYVYFYLQSGSFAFYFSGTWTVSESIILAPGFFFAPYIPVFVAAPLTLVVFSFASFFFFKGLEQFFWKQKLIKDISYQTLLHRMKIVAAFVAFNTFYAFAGAPSYSDFPLAYGFFHAFIFVFSTFILYKEIYREENYFIQERFALKIIKRWDSTKPLPKNLKEIYYTYSNDKKNKDKKLKTYKDTLRDLIEEGILTDDSMVLLEKLREQMGISELDHLNTIRALKRKNEELFDKNIEQSPERRYQKRSYKKMLENTFDNHIEIQPSVLKSLQKQFFITNEDHKAIVEEIFNSSEKLKKEVLDLLTQMKLLYSYENALAEETLELSFLKYVLQDEFNNLSKELFKILDVMYESAQSELLLLKDSLKYKDKQLECIPSDSTIALLGSEIGDAIVAFKSTRVENNDTLEILQALLAFKQMNIVTSALLCLKNYDMASYKEPTFSGLGESRSEELLEVIEKVQTNTTSITLYEKMMYLHTIAFFSEIKFNPLKLLSKTTEVLSFSEHTQIITQGDKADSLFVLISGNVEVSVDGEVVSTLVEPSYFGEIGVIADVERTASIKALSDIVVLKLSAESFKKFLYANPSISIKLMKAITLRLLHNQKI